MKRVGRHTIVRELASSGVLSTFEATHEGRAVRLRVVDADLGELDVGRFEDDLAQVAALRHVGVDKPVAWSARAPVHVSTASTRDASLKDVCDRAPAGRVAVDVARGVAADVAEALHAAHSTGLVHAGLSPESILLGTDGRARVTDFGLMRWLNDRSSTHPQIMRGAIEGLAPEQLAAPETVGPHTDVFGLGLVLYRAMTGTPAFDAPSALGMSIRLSMGRPTPIESHGVEIPEALRALVMEMLSAAPTERPSMDVVIRALAKDAGPWRDSVRSLAASASRAASVAEAESESPWPEAPSTEAESPPRDPSPVPAANPTPLPVAQPAAEARPEWAIDACPSFELATEPALGLPEARDDNATLFELRAPDDVERAPARGGDTSQWPAPEHGHGVPKTVILEVPEARTPAPSLPHHFAFDEPSPPPEPIVQPGWAIWTAIALGAFALLVGSATFVILIAG